MENLKKFIALLSLALLASCAGNSTIKPETNTAAASSQSHAANPSSRPGAGGYYLDDGPGDNAPADIDGIPDAQLKTEVPLVRANKPYLALGQQYIPMTSYTPYKKQGIASWYGKKYHGKKTSTGEIYDMYGMSGAHTVLPIPSYAKVTNPANGRSVIVRINDRGPFKHDRLIDLSYAAAYKLRLINQGSGLVEVETIDTSAEAMLKTAKPPVAIASNVTPVPTSTQTPAVTNTASTLDINALPVVATPMNISTIGTSIQYYVQAGAFKNEANGDLLLKKIQGLQLAENVEVANVYNNALYRVRLGPYANRKEADISAASIRRQLNIPAIVQN
jgi:rare lipoprotein A